jgi:hypothetical protein
MEGKMAKFGLFGGNVQQPFQTFEGDEMQQNGDHVYVYKRDSPSKRHQVAAVKLADGQVVKEIEEGRGR